MGKSIRGSLVKKYNVTASFTDIHWGAKNNSDQHNEDCLSYIRWFCNQVKEYKADNIIFMGDWFENRNALNVSTLHYSQKGAEMLNDIGLPIYFIIGNHDLYHRHTREIYSTVPYKAFSNFNLITKPTIISEIETQPLICPFLFPNEYEDLFQYSTVKTWWGHFEFQGFVITGHTVKMPTGPDPLLFKGPKYIFSGHFHKRQRSGNIVYIGNTFPTNYGDAGETDRGMMIYNHTTEIIDFYDWPDCPQYVKTNVSTIIDNNIILPANARVKCLLDIPVTYEERIFLKQSISETYSLREFTFEDEQLDISLDTGEDDNENVDQLESTDELVIRLLNTIDIPNIDNNKLTLTYNRL